MIGTSMDVPTLPPLDVVVAGYLSGHVPYGIEDEIVWRVPAPRYYLDLQHARFPSKIWKRMAGYRWTVKINNAFGRVVELCGDMPRADATHWLTPRMAELYLALQRAGMACSFEVWDGDDLIGGEFGVLIAGTYFCETKFHTVSDAGNLCSGAAVLTLAAAGFTNYDTQYGPQYLSRFSSRGLEPFDAEVFSNLVERAAVHRFRHFASGAPTALSIPVLPKICLRQTRSRPGVAT
jgi:leucyl/phenylalanyl-tRNA--protein transferase